jgi:protein gp37
MAANTKIEWATHTFNPWRGCTKVSVGCANCYADTLSHRNPGVLGVWGPNGTRVVAAESAWREPLRWNRAAAKAGERHRVFCASLADVFEGPETLPRDVIKDGRLRYARLRLFGLIEQTASLNWLLLTKRPQNITPILAEIFDDLELFPEKAGEWPTLMGRMLLEWLRDNPPDNVWLGTSVENQQTADERIPHLLRVPAAKRFLSMEPLLGPVSLIPYLNSLSWVIVGGESGANARPMHPDWVRTIRDQCVKASVPLFFKQWGNYEPVTPVYDGRDTTLENGDEVIVNYDGSIHNERDGQPNDPRAWFMRRVGKTAAGRLIDGQEWSEVPT